MLKYILLIILILGLLVVGYLTFIMAIIEFTVGAVSLGVMLLALLAIWISWKMKKD